MPSDKASSDQIPIGQENKAKDNKTKSKDSTALTNSTNNAIQNEDDEEEQDNDSSNLNKSSGSESQAAAIARLNVTGDSSPVEETNNASGEANSDTNLPSTSTNITSNAVVPPPSEPLCNGHSQEDLAQQARRPSAGGGGENAASDRAANYKSGSPDGQASAAGDNRDAEQAARVASGNGDQVIDEQCWENSSRLVNSVSLDLESCDGEVEDMQTDGGAEEGKISYSVLCCKFWVHPW